MLDRGDEIVYTVKAESSGEIIEILVSDGEMVEFNQPLVLIKLPESESCDNSKGFNC